MTKPNSENLQNLEAEDKDLGNNPISAGDKNILDNVPCQTMIECCIRILEFLEESAKEGNAFPSDTQSYIKYIIFEHLLRIGCDIIMNESSFNPVRHQSENQQFIEPDSRIKVQFPGVELNGKVLIKAKVEPVKETKTGKLEIRRFPGVQGSYIRLYMSDPYAYKQRIPDDSTFWRHGEATDGVICDGDIYIGDDGTFLCEKCGKISAISDCDLKKPYLYEGRVSENVEKYHSKDLATSIVISNLVEPEDNTRWTEWLNRLIETLLSQDNKRKETPSNPD